MKNNDDNRKKEYSKLIKVLQYATGILMLIMVVVAIILIKKYNITLKNIEGLSEMLSGSTAMVAIILIVFSVVKSFALVFPPAVVFAVCAYVMPDIRIALAVNVVSMFLSMSIPYFLGRFTGKGMVETLAGKYKAVKKIDDFAGLNEVQMTFAVKLSGLMPGDLSSLLFGAMNVSFKSFTIGANLGMLPLALAYTVFGISLKSIDERPYVVAFPIAILIVFNIVASFVAKRMVTKTKLVHQSEAAHSSSIQTELDNKK